MTTRPASQLSRRAFLGAMSAVTAAQVLGAGSASASSELPLRTTGLEHLGMWVTDVAASGLFYGRVFNPFLHKEKEGPLRYYVTLGVGYLALGAAGDRVPQVDHYCALVEDYEPRAMAQQLAAAGLKPGRFGMIPDPDGIRLQLLGTPGGLAKSTEPAGRIAPEEPLVKPMGLESVVLDVSDVERALPFYRTFFGRESTAPGNEQTVWFELAATRLGIRQVPAGQVPMVSHFRVNVRPFDARAVANGLEKLGATLLAAEPETGLVRCSDPDGIVMELKSV